LAVVVVEEGGADGFVGRDAGFGGSTCVGVGVVVGVDLVVWACDCGCCTACGAKLGDVFALTRNIKEKVRKDDENTAYDGLAGGGAVTGRAGGTLNAGG
jgi:hypothetical protein